MGLDITAYEIIERLDPQPSDDGNYGEGDRYFYVERHKRARGMQSGYYRTSGRFYNFRAGSYHGYNAWRAELSQMTLGCSPNIVWNSPKTFAGKPFVELIDFSDCEGTIGPEVSAKLARDFDKHETLARTFASKSSEDGDLFLAKYYDWQKAFHLAADHGAVSFH